MAPRKTEALDALPPAEESAPASFIRDLLNVDAEATPIHLPRLSAPKLPFEPELELGPRRAADAIVEALVEAGVDTFFGIPGGPVSSIFDAILNCSRARLIESRHETGAAFAAAGYHRASGRVPCVVVTAGPGATNAVTGIVSAHLEQVPMLVISGDVAWAAEGARLLQNSGPEGIDIESMLRGVTRATIRVAQAKSASAHALAAFRAATDPERPGPALLVVPIHRAAAETESPRVVSSPPTARKTALDADVVEHVCSRLAQAERPLLVFGAGARGHARTLARLVDVLDVPFVTTPRAKGVVSERHPRSLRHGGLAASMWARKYTARGVDVALVLGTDLDDCAVGPTPYIAPRGELIHVDLDARVFNRNLDTRLGVVAELGEFAEAMLECVRRFGLRNGNIRRELKQLRQESAFDVPNFAEDESSIITPYRALADLERAGGRQARFVTDIGEHMLFALHYLTADSPDQFLINLGLGSMGSGICSAVGLALGDPDRTVICVCGDGGMQMAGMEAMVALKEGLKVVFAVFNDARYNMVYHGYRQLYGRAVPWETEFIDFAGWARSLSIPSARINHPGEITSSLLEALTRRGPALLDIRIDRRMQVAGGGRNEALQRMSALGGPHSVRLGSAT
ncbi:MAG: thiamine pyrophosphate-binding protein [Myxococcota bacterium]